MKMHQFLLINAILISSAFPAVGPRHVEQTGGYSFCAPQGWQFGDFPGMKFQVVAGAVKDSFAANMNVVDEAFSGPLKSYVDASVKIMEKVFVQFTLIGRKPFVTASGIKGEILIISCMQQKNLLRQTYLILSNGKGKNFIVTCSCREKDGDAFAKIFEESLRTFELTR